MSRGSTYLRSDWIDDVSLCSSPVLIGIRLGQPTGQISYKFTSDELLTCIKLHVD